MLILPFDVRATPLLSLCNDATDDAQIGQMGRAGGRVFAPEARLRDEGKEPIVLPFPVALDRDAAKALRGADFRFSKVLQHREGFARPDDAEHPPRHTAAPCGPLPPCVPEGRFVSSGPSQQSFRTQSDTP
jgi:hypothetical protein